MENLFCKHFIGAMLNAQHSFNQHFKFDVYRDRHGFNVYYILIIICIIWCSHTRLMLNTGSNFPSNKTNKLKTESWIHLIKLGGKSRTIFKWMASSTDFTYYWVSINVTRNRKQTSLHFSRFLFICRVYQSNLWFSIFV